MASHNSTHTISFSSKKKKKARVGLTLEIELAVPFLSATEDLHLFAAVSSACRDAARESYDQRRNSSIKRTTIQDGKPTRLLKNVPDCYRKPWWSRKEQRDQGWSWGHSPLQLRDSDVTWALLEEDEDDFGDSDSDNWFGRYRLKAPDSFLLKDDDNHEHYTELVHCSIVKNLLLVIICRWTDRGEIMYNAKETRKQLFGLLYNVQQQNQHNNTNNTNYSLLHSIVCEPLLHDPLDRNNYGCLDYVYFGNAERSRNGQVVAVVTALPLGNEDNEDDEEPRETARVSIYDIVYNDDDGKAKICKRERDILVPCGARTYESGLTMSIDNRGEYLSIATTQDCDEGGFWGVFNITSSSTCREPIFQIDPLGNTYNHNLDNHQFTPDNELLLTIGENLNGDTFLTDGEIPSYLLKRMIVLPSYEH